MNNMYSNIQHDNELSFLELMKLFWQQRMLIMIVTLICFCLCLGYLFYAKPIYEADTLITPPVTLDLSALNAAAFHDPTESLLKKYSIENIYALYLHNLLSESTKRKFFEKVYFVYLGAQADIEYKEVAYQKFLKIINIKQDAGDKNIYRISLSASSSQEAQELLSRYLKLALEGLLIDIKKDLNYQLKAKLLNIKLDLRSTKQLSQIYLSNSLRTLKSALNEAKAEKLDHFLEATGDNGHFESFMLGTKILAARIEELKKQEIASELIKRYLKLKTDFSFYSSIANSFSSEVQFDQFNSGVNAFELPIRPKWSLLLFISLLGGCILGSTIVIIIFFINQSNESIKTRAKSHSSKVLARSM